MKKVMAAVVLFAASKSFANYPVFDVQNFGKMVESVRELHEQVNQLKATYEALHGVRGLGDVLYNPALRQYLPEKWAGIYDDVAAGGYAGISGSINDIEKAERLAGTVTEQMEKIQKRSHETAVANKAVGIRAYDGAQARLGQIESLMGQVNRTQDVKAVAEIQARIAVEQAAVANEATKLQLMQMLQQAEDKLQAQQRHEAAQKILSPDNTGMPACCLAR